MKLLLLSLLIAVSAIVAAGDRQNGNIRRHRVLKPVTTILIIVLALLAFPDVPQPFYTCLLIGLIFCLAGDVFLMFEKYFVFGLAAFLVGHVLFIIGFTQFNGFLVNPWVIVPLLLFGFGYYYFLWPDLKKLAIPVAFYFIAILLMDLQAISLYVLKGSTPFLLIMLGALLFTFSDSMIALRKFKKPFKNSEWWILSTYWIAIYMLAYSAHLV
ncbi:MAG: lysoplasmalogenase [Saprospiraceae bacterium]|nr:lysoplasmalogenase [Saprospiraceae bacterium]